MHDDEGEIVFLDDDDEPGDDPWPEAERIESGRDSSLLPPHAEPRRVLVTLVVLAVFLGGVGTAFGAAYHRHVTDRQLANELALAPASSPPQIPGLTALGFQGAWHARITKRISIPVVNRSPQPIELLGAVLEEPGLVAAATMAPSGTTSLKPGQTGTVVGEVTVDCTQYPASNFPQMDNSNATDIPIAGTSTLAVRARTSGGSVASASVNPDAKQGDVQQRICTQQGDEFLGALSLTSSWNASAHTATVTMSAPSHADVPLQYQAEIAISDPVPVTYGCVTGASRPTTPASGTVRPGETVTASYAIQMPDCSTRNRPSSGATITVTLAFSVNGTQLGSSGYGTSLDDVLPGS